MRNFESDFMVLDIATKITGYVISKNKKVLKSGIIDGNKYSSTWIPAGEGRSEKELYKKNKSGKLIKKRDTRIREDKLHNRIIYKHNEIKKLLIEYKPRYIIKEMPVMVQHSRNPDNRTGLDLAQTHSIINVIDIPIIVYYPVQWRSTLNKFLKNKNIVVNDIVKDSKEYKRTIKEKNKQLFVDFFYNEFKRLPLTNDESDAFCIFYHHVFLDNTIFSYENIKENYWKHFNNLYEYNYSNELI